MLGHFLDELGAEAFATGKKVIVRRAELWQIARKILLVIKAQIHDPKFIEQIDSASQPVVSDERIRTTDQKICEKENKRAELCSALCSGPKSLSPLDLGRIPFSP